MSIPFKIVFHVDENAISTNFAAFQLTPLDLTFAYLYLFFLILAKFSHFAVFVVPCILNISDKQAYCSYYTLPRSKENKAYPIEVGGQTVNIYCQMTTTSDNACEDGGWTLVMKTDGTKVYTKKIIKG